MRTIHALAPTGGSWGEAPLRGAAVALGNLDGLHVGHQAVIAAARGAGAGASPRSPLGVAVFDPHPRRFFQPHAEPFRILSDAVRDRLLAELGVEVLYRIPFDRALSLMDDRAFATEVLSGAMGVAHVAVGADFRFGRDRVGDVSSLETLGGDLGFGVTAVAPVGVAPADGSPPARASSTAIREAIRAGDMAAAAAVMTRPWIVDGVVERGAQRGRTIGVPTANVSLGELVRPKLGVYAVTVDVEGEGLPKAHAGVANIGRRPTFGGEDERLEVHLFDFDGDLYGRRIEASVRAFIRPERKFDGLAALKAQIALDAVAARKALGSAP